MGYNLFTLRLNLVFQHNELAEKLYLLTLNVAV